MKILTVGFLSLFLLGCNSDYVSKIRIQNIVKNSRGIKDFYGSVDVEVKLIKDILPEKKAVLTKIIDDKYALGFINKYTKAYGTIFEFTEKKDQMTIQYSWGINLIKTKKGKPLDEIEKLSVFYGIVPYKGFSEIEMKWNCNEVEKTTLVNGKYFLFAYPKHDMKPCNELFLIDEKGNRKKIEIYKK